MSGNDPKIPKLDEYNVVLPGNAACCGNGFARVLLQVVGTQQHLIVHCGFVEINGDITRVLCSSAEMPDQIELGTCEESIGERAQEADGFW